MATRLACLSILLAAAILAGCLPETRIAWSPDGKCALVRGGDGLYLCDGDGKLSPRIAEEVSAIAWMPDSRRFIAVCDKRIATWTDLAPHLPDAVQQAAKAQAESFRQQVLAYKGDWEKFSFEAKPADIVAALMCLRDLYGKKLGPAVGEKWKDLEKLQHTVRLVQLHEVEDGQAKLVKTLFESLAPMIEIRIAPGGKALAYTSPPYPPESPDPCFSLYVATLASPEKPRLVDDRVSAFFDWTPDGRALVYARANTPELGSSMPRITLSITERDLNYTRDRLRQSYRQRGLRVGRINKCTPLAEDGAPKEKMASTILADVGFFDSLPVRCLKDGRVLFAAREIHLPMAEPSSQPLSLFSLEPAGPKMVRLHFTAEARNGSYGSLELFQLSPDETRIAFPSQKGIISIVDLATGQVTKSEDASAPLKTIPVWRSNDELCFVVPRGSNSGSPTRQEVVLWSPTETRCISKDWPQPVAKGLLE
jgi:hypothetical protein